MASWSRPFQLLLDATDALELGHPAPPPALLAGYAMEADGLRRLGFTENASDILDDLVRQDDGFLLVATGQIARLRRDRIWTPATPRLILPLVRFFTVLGLPVANGRPDWRDLGGNDPFPRSLDRAVEIVARAAAISAGLDTVPAGKSALLARVRDARQCAMALLADRELLADIAPSAHERLMLRESLLAFGRRLGPLLDGQDPRSAGERRLAAICQRLRDD